MRALLARPLLTAFIIFSFISVMLWSASLAGLRWHDPERDQALISTAAATATIIAAMCIIFRVRRDREKLFLVNVIVDQHRELTQRASQARTIPFPRVVHSRNRD